MIEQKEKEIKVFIKGWWSHNYTYLKKMYKTQWDC